MRILIIDTATAACSVALVEGDTVVADRHVEVGRGHAEHLIPMIAALPGGGRAGHILVDVGPGSFTGIRVGIAAARGLALGWGATVAGYSSLAAIAMDCAINRQRRDPFAVVIEGGHGEVFMQSFAPDPIPDGLGEMVSSSTEVHIKSWSVGLTALDEMVSVGPDEAVARLGDRVALGSGVARLTTLPPEQNGGPIMPWAQTVPLLPESFRTLAPKPLYGRAPDAQIPQAPAAQR